MKTTLQTYQVTGTTAGAVATSVEEGVRVGALVPGARLPSIRALAAQLGLSPTTVAAAYRDLGRRGVVAGAGRAGTRVRGRPPVAVHLPLEVPAGVRDLRSGGPDPALLPRPVPVRKGATTRGYGEAPVAPRLGALAAERLAADGLDTSALAVVGGALDGVERVLGAWLRPGDRVAVEDPGYTATLDLLGAMSLTVVPVAVDGVGAEPDSLRGALDAGVEAVVLTPRAQNPTGAAWDVARAATLRAVLDAHPDVVVVEDDHAGPASGAPLHTVTTGHRRWATVRSVSKWLGPDLRLAVMVGGDPTTVGRVEGRQAVGTGWVSYLLQDAVAALWGAPGTTELLDRAARTYAARRTALLAALSDRGLTASGSSGLTAWVPVGDEHAVVAGLLEEGWAVAPGERFRTASSPGVRIAFATLAETEAPGLAAALSRCVNRRPVRTG